mgnify:CR=1 FL=1
MSRGPNGEAADGSLDAVFSAFAHERRRVILRTLSREEPHAVDLDTLAAAVCERTGPPNETAEDDRKRVRVALRHVHLPKLADSGLVEYDAEAGRVRGRGGTAERRLLSAADAYAADAPTE